MLTQPVFSVSHHSPSLSLGPVPQWPTAPATTRHWPIFSGFTPVCSGCRDQQMKFKHRGQDHRKYPIKYCNKISSLLTFMRLLSSAINLDILLPLDLCGALDKDHFCHFYWQREKVRLVYPKTSYCFFWLLIYLQSKSHAILNVCFKIRIYM